MRNPLRATTLLLPLLAAVLPASLEARNAAALKLAAVFSDHMVLQRDAPVPVWGWATPGETVGVEFAGQKKTTVADDHGAWAVALAPVSVAAKPQTLVVTSGKDVLTVEDVLVGEVWHASGQSNMAMTVRDVAKSLDPVKAQISAATYPSIRYLRVNEGESATPREDLRAKAAWRVCAPDTVPAFSAVSFFFARRLHEDLGVPVAVIDTSRGGTPIEPYIPLAAFDSHPTLKREVELAEQNDLAGLKKLAGGVFARDANWLPGRLFHSRLAPLARTAVRGVLWYQGESNCGTEEDPRDYRHKMTALVGGWRTALKREDLPFYYVQLPGSGAGANWPALREEQRLSAGLPHTGMVVTVDLAGGDIHPPNKVDVGERLARWALAKDYGKTIPYSGPLFSRVETQEDRIVVHFSYAESGLMVASKAGLEAPVETPGAELTLFEVSDAAGAWSPAEARISGQTVVVRSDRVRNPKAVRYAWQVTPQGCALYNRDGLPASPFRSDERP
jgi:sialate O-acetylesterase